MAQTRSRSNVQMTRGKNENLLALSDDAGTIRAAAMDQRGSLKRAIGKAKGADSSDEELSEFKAIVTEVLTPHATAILMDPEYGLEAIKRRAPGTGVLLAYEKTGYDANVKGRLPDLLPDWSVKRLKDLGANAIKILLYYDPDDDPTINRVKHAFIERVGAECRANDILFFLEPLAYGDEVGEETGFEFAKVKLQKVTAYMDEFSKPKYGVDVFRETLELAVEAGTPFAGVLCGRATWQDGIPEFGAKGADALRTWLEDRGVQNIEALNRVLEKGARPWWEFYGGKDKIEVVERG